MSFDVTTPILWKPLRELKPNPLNREIYEDHEDDVLDAHIKQNGIIRPIIINSNDVIIDGHRRWRRAIRYGLETVPVQIRDFPNAKVAMVMLNRYRQKSDWELLQEAKVLEAELKPKAKERQVEAGKQFGVGKPQSNLTEPISQASIRDQVADSLDISSGKLYQLQQVEKAITEHPTDPHFQKIKQGLQNREITANRAFEKVQQLEGRSSKAKASPLLTGFEMQCPKCQAKLLLDHRQFPDGKTDHKLKELPQ